MQGNSREGNVVPNGNSAQTKWASSRRDSKSFYNYVPSCSISLCTRLHALGARFYGSALINRIVLEDTWEAQQGKMQTWKSHDVLIVGLETRRSSVP